MKIESIRNNPGMAKTAKNYCKEKWEKVYTVFCRTLDRSLAAEKLPETWLVINGNGDLCGFYQLSETEVLIKHPGLSPFISLLYVDRERLASGTGGGEMLLTHAKYEAARFGYHTLYLCTDHIGYYEKYGFRELGLDLDAWGRPTKLYAADTPVEVQLRIFDKDNLAPDEVLLQMERRHAYDSHSHDENPAELLRRLKHLWFPASYEGLCFEIRAFKSSEPVGLVRFMRGIKTPLIWHTGDLWVRGDCRCQGLASRMINRGIELVRSKCSGGEVLYSYIEKDNAPAIELHKKLGFENLSRIEPFEDLIFGEDQTTWQLEL
ncbi:MAG: GNAT family N-acetyltransferase [Oscillospiraceae bacterium]|nr:GNAT family N-acetyltransferase [Oscillospiraceae bacterium]